jgi:hypothetical protein
LGDYTPFRCALLVYLGGATLPTVLGEVSRRRRDRPRRSSTRLDHSSHLNQILHHHPRPRLDRRRSHHGPRHFLLDKPLPHQPPHLPRDLRPPLPPSLTLLLRLVPIPPRRRPFASDRRSIRAWHRSRVERVRGHARGSRSRRLRALESEDLRGVEMGERVGRRLRLQDGRRYPVENGYAGEGVCAAREEEGVLEGVRLLVRFCFFPLLASR